MTTIFGWIGLVVLGFRLDKVNVMEMMLLDPDTIISIKIIKKEIFSKALKILNLQRNSENFCSDLFFLINIEFIVPKGLKEMKHIVKRF